MLCPEQDHACSMAAPTCQVSPGNASASVLKVTGSPVVVGCHQTYPECSF